MNSLAYEARAKKVTFDKERMWVELVDGRTLGVPLAFFPRLLRATVTQRKRYTMSGNGIGLHWDALDEDISVPALLANRVDQSSPLAEAA